MAKSKDLFDDNVMSFGEHLEVLRVHLWKALIGLVIGVIISLFFGKHIVAVIRRPIDEALEQHFVRVGQEDRQLAEIPDRTFWQLFWGLEPELPDDSGAYGGTAGTASPGTTAGSGAVGGTAVAGGDSAGDPAATEETAAEAARRAQTIVVQVKRSQLREALGISGDGDEPDAEDATVDLALTSPAFAELQGQVDTLVKNSARTVSLTVQEAFMIYLKVSLVTGLVLSSPWVIYQIWLFVAAGLYPHERHYVYIYLPMSVGLFLGGTLFCFFMVFPFVLKFLLGFNAFLEVLPQIRLSEWISFALMLPLMFGLSFQLPLVMLFLERISIFTSADYKAKWRMAIFAIAIVSMLMTPADPMSMMMMMAPLTALYVLGIVLCDFSPTSRSPFDDAEPA